MKKGDIVTIQDISYSISVINGELKYPGRNLRYTKCKIIEVGCTFPKTAKWDNVDTVNDTIIQICETGQVIFIEERFLKLVPPTHEIMIDIKPTNCAVLGIGQVVEISDKLYKEIKREPQTQQTHT